jgi:hypothetical protein
MPQDLPTSVLDASVASVFADPLDTSAFRLSFDTPEGRLQLRLSQSELTTLAQQIEVARQPGRKGFQTQVYPMPQSK